MRTRPPRVMYIENKSASLMGPARIGWVSFTKTGRTLKYRDQQFRSLDGTGFKANYFDVETGDEYWISGCKQRGSNRLYGERIPVHIDEDAREEYWCNIRRVPQKVTQETADW